MKSSKLIISSIAAILFLVIVVSTALAIGVLPDRKSLVYDVEFLPVPAPEMDIHDIQIYPVINAGVCDCDLYKLTADCPLGIVKMGDTCNHRYVSSTGETCRLMPTDGKYCQFHCTY